MSFCTDKKENQIFLYMRKYFPIYEEAVSHTVYDFATGPFRISL
jgi:hypothetical protein